MTCYTVSLILSTFSSACCSDSRSSLKNFGFLLALWTKALTTQVFT